jgi:hypothetical protein
VPVTSEKTGKGGRRGLVAVLVSFAFALLVVELASFAFFSRFRDRFTFFEPERLTLAPEKRERAARIFDAELGWRRRFDTPFGERPRVKDYGRPLLATFGDSFTYGEQVRAGETYQTTLAELLRADVYNFGHGGHGPDQALLWFRDRYPRVRTPLVSIGLITENVNRIVNVFRPFYSPRTALALSKPRFRLVDGELVRLPNPIRTVEELAKLGDPEFVRSLGANDWWDNRGGLPELRFPYLAILANRHLWREAVGRGEASGDLDPRPWENLWDVDEARELLFAILEAFHEEARAAGGTPLVVLSPRRREVVDVLDGRGAPNAARLIRECDMREWVCFDGVDAIVSAVEARSDVRAYFDHHLTPLGNRVFAERLAAFLVARGLVDRPAAG